MVLISLEVHWDLFNREDEMMFVVPLQTQLLFLGTPDGNKTPENHSYPKIPQFHLPDFQNCSITFCNTQYEEIAGLQPTQIFGTYY